MCSIRHRYLKYHEYISNVLYVISLPTLTRQRFRHVLWKWMGAPEEQARAHTRGANGRRAHHLAVLIEIDVSSAQVALRLTEKRLKSCEIHVMLT